MSKKPNRGFSLVELMVTIAILATVSAIALPNLAGVLRSNRVSSATNELNATFAYARSEAMRQNSSLIANPRVDVVLCAANAAGTGCGTDWENGWLVVQRTGTNVTNVLRYVQMPSRMEIESPAGFAPEYVFDHRGRVSGLTGGGDVAPPQNLTLQPIPADCKAGQELVRTVNVTRVGQFRAIASPCA